jgi:MerR family transcriptional regulator, light-induced transcriptional regulator
MDSNQARVAKRHPIGVVSERTGLSQDVLRAWERRYNVAEPSRSPGGQRLYSDAEIERLRLLHLATRAGRTISRVAHLSTEELAELVSEDEEAARSLAAFRAVPGSSPEVEDHHRRAYAAMAAVDDRQLESVLWFSATTLGMATFMDGVVVPLLRRIGEEWHAGRLSPAEEHLVTSTVQRVLHALMQPLPVLPGAPVLVASTPAGELHAVGTAMVTATALAEGWRAVYLGPDLPATAIADVARRVEATVVALSMVYVSDRERSLEQLRSLRSLLGDGVAVLVGGAGAQDLAPELRLAGLRVIDDLPGLRVVLRELARARSSVS